MSEQNVTLAREGYDAWNRGDTDWFVEHITEDLELRPAVGGLLELEEVYRGREGFKKFWTAWRTAEAWSEISVRIDRIEDLGEDEVLGYITFQATGRESGAPVALPVAHWIGFRDGLVSRLEGTTLEEAERRLAERGGDD